MRSSRGSSSSTARAKALDRKYREHAADTLSLDALITKVYVSVVKGCVRDVSSEIRRDCLRTLGLFAVTLPAVWLQDRYLRYLGWGCNDQEPSVRLGALEAIADLYEAAARTADFQRREAEVEDSDEDSDEDDVSGERRKLAGERLSFDSKRPPHTHHTHTTNTIYFSL